MSGGSVVDLRPSARTLPLLTSGLCFHRNPVAGHCAEGPRRDHQKDAHGPVVRSPHDPTEGRQEAGVPGDRGGRL